MKTNSTRFIFAGILALGICAAAAAAETVSPTPADLFAQANSKYQAGEFKEAYSLYKRIVLDGRPTPAVYYNLANAAFKTGSKGEALLYYRRAARWIPRDPDLEWNLSILQGALTDRPGSSDQPLPLYLLGRALEKVSMDELAVTFSGSLAFLVLAALLNLLWPVLARRLKSLTTVFWLLALAAALSLTLKWAFELSRESVVILERQVTARYGPSQRETQAFTLHEGAEARVLDEVKDWYYVSLDNKTVGWIPKTSCQIV